MNSNLSYVEVSSQNLLHNFRTFKNYVHSTIKMISVVKANAYGHGLEEVVQVLDDVTDYFAVDDIEELRRVRKISQKPVIVLGYVQKQDLEEIVSLNAEVCIYDMERLETLNTLGKKLRKPKVHIKIDASLGRQGILLSELETFIKQLKKMDSIELAGVYSHFANIEDTTDFSHAQKQIVQYKKAVGLFYSYGYKNFQTHLSSTAATLVYEKNLGLQSMVRIGIGLYGLWPSENTQESFEKHGLLLKPVMRWISHVAQVKKVPRGFSIGYGLTYITSRPMTIAVIPQGYSDGYDRGLSNKGVVLIKGTRCKVLGRIAMNMFVVDVSHISHLKAEDEVVLLGSQGNETVSAEELAEKIGTINYEVVARISPLLPKIIK
ncbi:MAG: alanine racemase [bacterium]|nr:alanine racemase [bacterium]